MAESVQGLGNESILHLHEVLSVESHLWMQSTLWIGPSDLHELFVNVVMDNPIQLLPHR